MTSTKEKKKKWKGSRAEIYFNQRIQELIEEKIDHLVEHYEGPTDFFETQLENEETLSVEEKLKEINEEMSELERQRKQLQQVLQDRREQQQYQDKRELLKTKQDKLREIENEGVKTFSDLMGEEAEKRKDRGYDVSRPEIAWTVKKRAEERLKNQPDVDELRSEVERLQREVAELNGGREDWFLDLQSVEVSA